MVNPNRKVCRKTNQEVNTDGQREGRGMRGEEGKNRTQDSAHSGGDGRVVLSQKAEGQELRDFPPSYRETQIVSRKAVRGGAILFCKESTSDFQRSDADS